jgi:hypothetical protein
MKLFPQKNRKLLHYGDKMVFMWPFWVPCTRHKAAQWTGLLGSTWASNVCSKSTCPLSESWKTIMCYGLCWVKAIVRGKVLLGNLGKHSMVGQNLEMSRETSTIYIHPHNVMVFMICPRGMSILNYDWVG